MKKQIISLGTLTIGFLLGASALTALAQTGTWNSPTQTPPGGNVAAPINVGDGAQTKTGLLSLANFLFNPTGQSNVPVGSVLTALNSNGLVGWRTPSSTAAPGTCRLLTTTVGFNIPDSRGNPGRVWDTLPVPNECINSSCSLFMPIYRNDTVVDFNTTILTQFRDVNTGLLDWWVKPASANDGISCTSGRNGTTAGCDGLLATDGGTITLYDDHASGEMSSSQWTIKDSNSTAYVEIYVCK